MTRLFNNSAVRRLSVSIFLLMATFLIVPVHSLGDSVNTSQRTVTKLADGIYEIWHKDAPSGFPQSNTVVIIGDTEVLVVDSCYLPSSAREDIAQIRQWTDKPVRYLLNTHRHGDHNFGNVAYAEAFPGIAIIAQTETAKDMARLEPITLAEYPQVITIIEKDLETGKHLDGSPLTENDRRDLKNAKDGINAVWVEFRNLKPKFPNVTFDHELDVDLGNRQVQLKYLGRGNTAGDAIAYLPKEKILITGDLVDHPVPYLGHGFPVEQIVTLKKMLELDADTIVPGHGDVLHDKTYVQQEIEFLEVVVAAVSDEIGRSSADPMPKLDKIRRRSRKMWT